MIVITDVHGCFKTLKALMAKLPADEIVFAGDLVDRGPMSLEVLRFVKDGGYKCVLGNHEHMMLAHYGLVTDSYGWQAWLNNGGQVVKNQLDQISDEERTEILSWVWSLPLYLDFTEVKDAQGNSLFVSHSGVRPDGPVTNYNLEKAVDIDQPATLYDFPLDDTLIWYRGTPAKLDSRFHIFGHTPTSSPDIQEYYACIDTGVAYARRGSKLGKLTALRFPEMEIYQQECVDDL